MTKRIGIIGGLSPESTSEYYLYITHTFTERFGDHSYPEIVIYSVSFQPYIDWPKYDQWDLIANGLIEAAHSLEASGVDFILIATNTMHLVFDRVQAAVKIPMLNLVDTVGDAILQRGLKTVGLLGTRFTMEKTFYQETLAKKGIHVLTPSAEDREYINDIIYTELVTGKFTEQARKGYLKIIDKLAAQGAEGIILGCTEIPLLIRPGDTSLPLFDTTRIHAEAALKFALE
jgi:aspartate racemase